MNFLGGGPARVQRRRRRPVQQQQRRRQSLPKELGRGELLDFYDGGYGLVVVKIALDEEGCTCEFRLKGPVAASTNVGERLIEPVLALPEAPVNFEDPPLWTTRRRRRHYYCWPTSPSRRTRTSNYLGCYSSCVDALECFVRVRRVRESFCEARAVVLGVWRRRRRGSRRLRRWWSWFLPGSRLVLRINSRVEHRDLLLDRGGRGDGAGAAHLRGADRGAALAVLCRGTRRVDGRVQLIGSGLKCCSLSNCVSARFLEPLDAPLERPQRQGHPFTVEPRQSPSWLCVFCAANCQPTQDAVCHRRRLKRSDPGLWGLHERGTIGP